MKGSSWLAIGVCIACFLIGYLTYVAASFIVDFFIERFAPCQYTAQICAQQQTLQKDR